MLSGELVGIASSSLQSATFHMSMNDCAPAVIRRVPSCEKATALTYDPLCVGRVATSAPVAAWKTAAPCDSAAPPPSRGARPPAARSVPTGENATLYTQLVCGTSYSSLPSQTCHTCTFGGDALRVAVASNVPSGEKAAPLVRPQGFKAPGVNDTVEQEVPVPMVPPDPEPMLPPEPGPNVPPEPDPNVPPEPLPWRPPVPSGGTSIPISVSRPHPRLAVGAHASSER